MTPNVEWFHGCVISDTELTINEKYFPFVNEASFGKDWIELTVLVRYSEKRSFAELVKPLREAKKIAIIVGAYPPSGQGPQMQRSFEPVALVAERYETRPLWPARLEAEGMQNIDGKNAPAWYCVCRFEVQS